MHAKQCQARWDMRSDSGPERRDALLRDLEESGLSMAEFCRRRGLVYGSVAAWRSAARRRPSPRPFVEIDSSDSGPSPTPTQLFLSEDRHRCLAAELLLPGGIVLRIFERNQAPAEGGRG